MLGIFRSMKHPVSQNLVYLKCIADLLSVLVGENVCKISNSTVMLYITTNILGFKVYVY